MVQISSRTPRSFSWLKLQPLQLFGIVTVCMTIIHFVWQHLRDTPNNFDTRIFLTSQNSLGTIGYFVSITSCGGSAPSMAEGAAVLKHSIHLASVHGPLGGKYDYKMHAIYHPDALSCVQELEKLGYELNQRNTPVAVKDIQGDFLREKIVKNGCCGEKELIKLEAYTFEQYPVVVHLDLDVLILKPLDVLFDAMIVQEKQASATRPLSKIELMWPDRPIPSRINAFFTRDCK